MAFTGTERHRPLGRRASRRAILTVIGVVVAVAAAAIVTAVVLRGGDTAYVRASTTATGSDLQRLVSGQADTLQWRPTTGSTGTWVESHFASPRALDRVRLSSAGKRTFTSARLSFSDGSALLLTPDRRGRVDVSFPARTARSVRLTVAEGLGDGTKVGLAAFVLSNDGSPISTASPGALRATASSTAAGSTSRALIDGDPEEGGLGAEWRADPAAASARAGVTWTNARPIASVRLWGPSAAAFDPAYSAAAALNGSLLFSDGSRVRISGIAGGADGSTTVAFTPRVVTGVTAVLERTIPQATIGLRAIAVRAVGATRPVPDVSGGTSGGPVAATPGVCDGTTAPSGIATPDVISLVCPSTGSSVTGRMTLRVAAPVGTAVTASMAPADGGSGLPRRVAAASVGGDGTAALTFSTDGLPRGPFTVAITSSTSALRPLHVQLVHGGGRLEAVAPARHGSASLVWDEEFTRGVSISSTGAGATYGALKPEYWGGSQFGDAVFDDPASGAGTFSVVDGALRIRAQPIGARPDPSGTGRAALGGLLSSLRVGASGFSAQYGYYEARMMAPAGFGTWPAFWMMSADSATKVSDRSTEVDAVELYGNRTKQTCHSIHDYVAKQDDSTVRCVETAIDGDWAVGWHTYGVQILPGEARFFVDGRFVMTQTGLTNSDQPFFFMANLALGGGWPVDLSPTGGRAELWIDRIRVYV